MPWPYNTFQPNNNQYQQLYGMQPPQMQVVRVNGRGGAEAFSMGANSSALLLDESGRIVWAVTTDGAGYKTISPYDITPHQDAPAPDYSGLEGRIARLEGIVNEYTANSTAARKTESFDEHKQSNGATNNQNHQRS